jgi:hypothetical protein
VWTQYQHLCIHLYGPDYAKRLELRRKRALRMLRLALSAASATINQGGEIAFEWPRRAAGWQLPVLQKFIIDHDLFVVDCDGCRLGLRDVDGIPFLKQWRIVTNSQKLASTLNSHQCNHPKGYKHAEICGSKTVQTGFYPRPMCQTIIQSWFAAEAQIAMPAMTCQPPLPSFGHREKDNPSSSMFDPSTFLDELQSVSCPLDQQLVPAFVTRLLDRKEMLSNPKALEKVREEARGLEGAGTWDL